MMSNKRIMLVAPHADDEMFGAGGTLLRLKSEGCEIKLILVACSDIWMHHVGCTVGGNTRRDEFVNSAKQLSTEDPMIYYMNDSRLDEEPIGGLIRLLDGEIRSFRPDVFFMPEPSYHQDHQYVHRACVASLRPTVAFCPSKILAYEVPTSTWSGIQSKFVPNVYVNIDQYHELKCSLFKDVYRSQYVDRERKALAMDGMISHMRYRGCEIGVEFAEAFMLMREIL